MGSRGPAGAEAEGVGGDGAYLCFIWCDIVAEEDLAAGFWVEDLDTAGGCEVVKDVGDDS